MERLMDVWRDGGFGMFPTLVFGLLLLGIAGKYALSPEKRWVPLMIASGLLTLFAGTLGFVSGIITTCRHALEIESRPIIMIVGFGESLVNVAFALVFAVLAAMAATVGAARLARAPA